MKRKLFLLFAFWAFLGVRAGNAGGDHYLFLPHGADFYVYGNRSGSFIINRARITDDALKKDIERLSSGKRINRAADDPAGLAVAEKMDALIEGLRRDSMNDEDARNRVEFVDQALAHDLEIIKRMRELVIRSMSGILQKSDRELIQSEIDQMLDEIDSNAKYAEFNRVKVLPELTAVSLGLSRVNVVSGQDRTLSLIDEGLARILRLRALVGSKSNVLGFRIEGKRYYFINFQEAESRIRDQDMAEGITSLVKNSVLLRTKYGVLVKGK